MKRVELEVGVELECGGGGFFEECRADAGCQARLLYASQFVDVDFLGCRGTLCVR